jgi:hypothetical protein
LFVASNLTKTFGTVKSNFPSTVLDAKSASIMVVKFTILLAIASHPCYDIHALGFQPIYFSTSLLLKTLNLSQDCNAPLARA